MALPRAWGTSGVGLPPPSLAQFSSVWEGARGSLELTALPYRPRWGSGGHWLGWGSTQMETDVGQMWTAGVGLEAMGGERLHGLWGRGRELV